MSMKRVGLGMAVITQFGALFMYPWHTLNKYVIEQINLKISPYEQENKILSHESVRSIEMQTYYESI